MSDGILKYKLNKGAQSKAQICAKIDQLELIIASLYDTALASVGAGNKIEYELDTGQTKIKVKYSSTTSVTSAIKEYEKLQQMLRNKLTPRNFRLMHGKNFRG